MSHDWISTLEQVLAHPGEQCFSPGDTVTANGVLCRVDAVNDNNEPTKMTPLDSFTDMRDLIAEVCDG